MVLILSGVNRLLAAEDELGLLIDRQPFDRVILDTANDNTVIDVVLLDLPDRRVPDPMPQNGNLELRRLSHPSIRYTVDWNSIARIELYEELVLREALALTDEGNSSDAFRTLQFLHNNYPDLIGLDAASERYIKRDALDAFSAKRYDDSLAILLSLYDINPRHRGLADAVQAVSDRVINAHLSERDFYSARSVLDLLKQGFLDLDLPTISTWESKFERGAGRQLQTAQSAIANGQFDEARLAIRRAKDILPNVAGATELLREIDRLSPEIIVGVNQLVSHSVRPNDLRWSPSRVARLTNPQLIEMVGFGGEGGQYQSDWVSLVSDDSGLQLDLTLDSRAILLGFTPERISLGLLGLADPLQPQFQGDFASLFRNVTIQDGRQVGVHWKRPPVRPEALVRLSIIGLINPVDKQNIPGVYQAVAKPKKLQEVAYMSIDTADSSGGSDAIVERVFENEEHAITALQQGSVSVLDRVAPWLIEPLKANPQLVVETYRLPTVHVLQLNHVKPLLNSREFRRALVYGINRQGIVKDILLGGDERPGFRVLSGPLPAGVSITDPVGYGYNQQLVSRPYEPRLASVLATVARDSLAKQRSTDADPEKELEPEDTPPLLLVYPPNSLSRTCCQTIQQQLEAIGIPVEIEALPTDSSAIPSDYDLLYAELAIREPLVDARRLLGPRGQAGSCSSSMSLALEQLDQSRNWRQARERMHVIHQVAHNDLPVIPLWQTIDSMAYHKSLQGLGSGLITLYQNVADWKVSYDGDIR